ncbi:MAG: HAMP domain-containing sensor histidine kinase [Eubacteriales bacterium]|nr:HAMP domain-containing sensor histidine kinase [Eubacteriales bacterium]
MSRGIFGKLMGLFIAVILVCVLLMLGVFGLSARDAQIASHIQALKIQAYDIAYLASVPQPLGLSALLGTDTISTRRMMERKLRGVYQDYGAYALVVDRTGQVTSYFSSVLDENEELAASFEPKTIVDTLIQVLGGQEVVRQTQGPEGTMITMAVPWKQDDRVLGAVYIQTAAQAVRESYEGIWLNAALAALFAAVIAAVIAYFFTRRLVRPLEEIAGHASIMARGLPVPQISENGAREVQELAVSFNHMSRQIQDTERIRRDFIANLSHELRSPMTNIQGFIQGIIDGTIEQDEAKSYLHIVLNETKRLNTLIAGLFRLSQAESPESPMDMIDFDICELVRLVVITKLPQIEGKSLEVLTDFEEDSLYARAARDQIEQVLINLLDNAIKFTPSGGQIRLSVSRKAHHLVAVRVEDNGIGVLPEEKGRLFERFYKSDQAHASGEGSGLGLAICKSIMDRHGQTIRLADSNRGAAFEFTLMAGEAPKRHAD